MKYRWNDSIGAPISFLVDMTKNYTVAMINFKNGNWFGVVKDKMIGPYESRSKVISVVEERLGLESGTTTGLSGN
jgi:hypothetical protein